MKETIIPLSILLILPTIISAADYYVSPIGSASWSECTDISIPCSLNTANQNAQAGDTVYLRGGTYSGININPSNSGTAWDNQIIFQAYNGETPIITGGVTVIYISGKDYIKVDGITATNVARFFLIVQGSDRNEIANCNFSDCNEYSCGFIGRWSTIDSNYNWIHNNTFTQCGSVSGCSDRGTLCRIGYDAGMDRSNNNLIEDNVFSYGGHDLMDIGGNHNIIRNNIGHNEEAYFEDPGGCVNSPDSGYMGNRCLLLQWYYQYGDDGDHIIEGNRFGHAGTPPDDDGAFGISISSERNIIRYNSIFGSGAAGLYWKSGFQPNDNHVYHNTLYHNGYGDPDINDIFKSGMLLTCGFSGNEVKNNIAYDDIATYKCIGSCICDTALYTDNNFTNTYTNEPGFVNTDMSDKTSLSLPDLSLQSGSDAIDGGIPLTTVANSDTGSGTSLIVNDAGYFQDGSWGPNNQIQADWIAVGTADNAVQIQSIDYDTGTITLANPILRSDGEPVWLYKDSTGKRVLYGSAPDFGAYEYHQEPGIYWVSDIGTSEWSGCRSETSLDGTSACSLSTANLNVQAGDIVYLRSGTYQNGAIRPVNSGSPDDLIIFSSYNNEPVLFDGLGSTIEFDGDSYVKVHGINMTNSEFMLRILRESHHIEISHCSFTDTVPASNGVPRKSLIQGNSTHNWIHDSLFARAGYADELCGDRGGLLTVGTAGVSDDQTSYNLIENNVFYHGGHHLVEIASHHNVIRNNFMHNEGWMECSHCQDKPPLCGNRNIGGASNNDYRNLYENNIISFGGIPPDNQMGAGLECLGSYSIVRKNRIYNNSGAGIMPYEKGCGPVDNNRIYSNTIYHNAVEDITHLRGGICFVRSYNNSIKNNILYANGEGDFCEYSYNKGFMDYQTLENNWNDTDGDPLFIDPIIGDPFDQSSPNLRLQQGSEAIDAGAFLTSITSATGSGKTFTVNDADYFMDGWGIIEGDIIQLEGGTHRARITDINYDTKTITVNESISWTQGRGISLVYEGNAPDIGAYEYTGQTYHRSDTNQNGCIETGEMVAFMDRWKISSQDVTMPELMESIGIWKSGVGCS